MKKTVQLRIQHFLHACSLIWLIPTAILIAGLTLYTFTKTIRYTLRDELDRADVMDTNLLLMLISCTLVLILFRLFFQYVSAHLPTLFFVLFPLVTALAVSLYLIFSVHGLAVNDALALDGIVNRFMDGDFSDLTQKGSYLCTYPFQLGYVFYGQLIAILFGESNFIAYQILNLISILLTLYFLQKITKELFEDTLTSQIACLLSGGMLFLFVYSTHVYSDIPSLFPQTLAIYTTIRYLRTHRFRYMIFTAASLGIAIVLKNNAYIALIAIELILFIDVFYRIDNADSFPHLLIKSFLVGGLILLCGIGMPKLVRHGYAAVAGIAENDIHDGVPSSTYFAMGIQETDQGQSGWYNGYNARTFAEHNYDRQATDAAARQRFSEDFSALVANPSHMAYFYAKKFLTQWGDASCISMRNLELASRHVEGHSSLTISIIYGNGRELFYQIMQLYHAVTLIGFLWFFITLFRSFHNQAKDIPRNLNTSDIYPRFLSQSFLILFIFGGMVFHELWEASSRYTMRYFIFFVPFAANGIRKLISK